MNIVHHPGDPPWYATQPRRTLHTQALLFASSVPSRRHPSFDVVFARCILHTSKLVSDSYCSTLRYEVYVTTMVSVDFLSFTIPSLASLSL
ncbi:hypothetical protein [Bacillus sp. FJAT-44742]|uniref:hypothetical protein n=1 Tax=Bacillus sp. FJAT-44742 TaxID=2014005 RepID=UPI0012FEEACC|nr:hypothetical protein [Bacillus sp. FJAT-44742]